MATMAQANEVSRYMSEQVQVTLHEAKSQLLQLGARAWQGDRVVITKAGKAYLDLLPHVATPQARKPGRLKGKTDVSGFRPHSRGRH